MKIVNRGCHFSSLSLSRAMKLTNLEYPAITLHSLDDVKTVIEIVSMAQRACDVREHRDIHDDAENLIEQLTTYIGRAMTLLELCRLVENYDVWSSGSAGRAVFLGRMMCQGLPCTMPLPK